ncbi:hypothetical protein D9M70_271190 [compost metagenome]
MAVDSSTANTGVRLALVTWAMRGASPRLLRLNSMREAVYSAEFRQLVTETRTMMSTISLAYGMFRVSSTVW